MKIIYLGKELDSTKEHELITENEFGFKVDIKYPSFVEFGLYGWCINRF